MNRTRVEGILAVFPKLLSESNMQHTFVEANNLRYVYQPIENLVVLVVTTRNSNIIEDLETLHLVAKVIPEYAGSIKEEAIVDHAFDIIFALDELITYGGMNEPIPLQQVRVNLAMESHEEKLLAMVQESKMNQAREIMKQKERELQSHQPAPSGLSFFTSLFSSAVSNVANTVRAVDSAAARSSAASSSASASVSLPASEPRSAGELSASLGRGMKLGGGKKESLQGLMAEDHLVAPARRAASGQASGANGGTAGKAEGAVHVGVEEELSVKLSRDGLIESVDVKGTLSVRVHDAGAAKVASSASSTPPSRALSSPTTCSSSSSPTADSPSTPPSRSSAGANPRGATRFCPSTSPAGPRARTPAATSTSSTRSTPPFSSASRTCASASRCRAAPRPKSWPSTALPLLSEGKLPGVGGGRGERGKRERRAGVQGQERTARRLLPRLRGVRLPADLPGGECGGCPTSGGWSSRKVLTKQFDESIELFDCLVDRVVCALLCLFQKSRNRKEPLGGIK
ncbi:uncharacterized protein [Blastocystis hominis]|uniref:Coatomer subunit delta n=1 Tax=Blastocystis hominis TaxID=12968 RepID=D8LVM5_BLAHO|nr:uncharacterized protein [Blastocystis hominis]CBK19864.2 unnamed protein product [Blastocystis hominis]|eukprot:XP_012893912.1 uncharacterized protein [Blastocystis hominis]